MARDFLEFDHDARTNGGLAVPKIWEPHGRIDIAMYDRRGWRDMKIKRRSRALALTRFRPCGRRIPGCFRGRKTTPAAEGSERRLLERG